MAGDAELPPAGWFDDPESSDHYRYWDGEKWLEERSPKFEPLGSASDTTPPSSRGVWTTAREEASKRHESAVQAKAACGRKVAERTFAGRTVKIYENGYVQVGIFKLSEPERLIGISASTNAVSKTAVGRGVAAVVTGGANLVLTPKSRGDAYLVITTERKTHSLHVSPPTSSDLKAMHTLEAAGHAVLAALAATPADTSAGPVAPSGADVAEQLSRLTQLHSAGALTDEEFSAAKAAVLGAI